MLTINENERLPNWKTAYEETEVEKMPWFWREIDPDIMQALEKNNLRSGTFLDLGTGPGTQADGLSKMGFEVTATDISHKAIQLAKEKFDNIDFIQDDVLNSKLNKKFDFIFDRGCFHCIDESNYATYVQFILKSLNEEGTFFLKCLSNKNEEIGKGPFLLSQEQIISFFQNDFNIEYFVDTILQGPKEVFVKYKSLALFVVMKKKA